MLGVLLWCLRGRVAQDQRLSAGFFVEIKDLSQVCINDP